MLSKCRSPRFALQMPKPDVDFGNETDSWRRKYSIAIRCYDIK